MFPIAKYYFIVFGLITIAGGVMGYVKANSLPSIIAGSVCGILLLASGFLMPAYWKPALGIGLVVCLGLAGRFLPALLKGKTMPAGFMAPLAIIGLVIAVIALIKASPQIGQ